MANWFEVRAGTMGISWLPDLFDRLRRYPDGTETASILATVRGSMPNCRAASRRLRPSICTA